ncbi:MAG: metallophosphoesterase [Clostridia bacterium]|nr:metallophosphoesterase [Clostridia bacterium]
MANGLLQFDPAVFAAGETYQILARVKSACAFAVEIDGKRYEDHTNGVVRTATRIHRVTVPQAALDAAKAYTVVLRPVIVRRAYRSRFAPEQRVTYPFAPIPAERVNIYHIADTHGKARHAVRSAALCGKPIDLLVLNGDIVNASDRVSDFDTIYRIAQGVTHGALPVICTRGNHDLRGRAAEKLGDYMPNVNGRFYYTLRLGALWALVLDCGEDKPDDHEEYGGAICCHAFREEETAFLHDVVARAAQEYAAPGVRHRLVIAHHPFTNVGEPPFDIEQPLFAAWAALLREEIRPELYLAGHYHRCFVSRPGDDFDTLGQACPVVVGAKPEGDRFTGCCVTLGGDAPEITFHQG